MALLQFDEELRPVRFIFDGEELSFSSPANPKYEYTSDSEAYGDGFKYGISAWSKQVLPQQFDEAGLLYGNKGFVRHNGKWGIIEILPDLDYSFKLNKGQDVAFRHQTFETQVRLDLPATISVKDARIEIPASSGESDYPFEVRIEADSVSDQYEKISETRYKCMVSNLQEGDNNLNILVTEKGCPPSVFPFEVYYTKPVPKMKTQEAVVVRKKSPQVPKQSVRIEL